MKTRYAVLLGLGACLAQSAVPLCAQIVTDRPDFVEAASIVAPLSLQIETSFTRSHDETALSETTTWATPTLFRLGLIPGLEARVESEWYVNQDVQLLPTADGLADIAVGLKGEVPLPAGPAVPALVWIVHADLPSGSDAFKGSGVRPSLRLVAEWELPHGFALGAMPGVIYDNGTAGRFWAGIFGLVIGKAWTDKVRSFIEVAFDQLAADSDGGTTGSFNLGGAYLLTNRLQLDGAASIGINDASDDFVFTVGLSALFELR